MGVAVIQVTTPSMCISDLTYTIGHVPGNRSAVVCVHYENKVQEEDPGH